MRKHRCLVLLFRRSLRSDASAYLIAVWRSQPSSAFVVADGLRYVQPYSSDFVFFCKKRWWNAPLLDMLKAEYKNPIPDYYVRGNSTLGSCQPHWTALRFSVVVLLLTRASVPPS